MPVGDPDIVNFQKKEFYNYNNHIKKDIDLPKMNIFFEEMSNDIFNKDSLTTTDENTYTIPDPFQYNEEILGMDIRDFFLPDSIYHAENIHLIFKDIKNIEHKNFNIIGRLPDLYNYKIFLITKAHAQPLKSENMVYLVTMDTDYNIISYVNIQYSSDSNHKETSPIDTRYDQPDILEESYWTFRGCYIDSNYIIHTKYFTGYGFGMSVAIPENYQILPNGKIVRYFEQKNKSNYVKQWERGGIKNHTKEGIWIERLGNKDGIWVKSEYKGGGLVGPQEYYLMLNNEERECLLYSLDIQTKKITIHIQYSQLQNYNDEDNNPCDIDENTYEDLNELLKQTIDRKESWQIK